MKTLFLVGYVAVLGLCVLSGTAQVSDAVQHTAREYVGTVYDYVTREPIPGATATLNAVDPSMASPPPAVTDAQGRFVMPGVEPHSYLLTVTAPGRQTAMAFGPAASGPIGPIRIALLSTPGLRGSLAHVGAVQAWVAAFAAMSVVLVLTRRLWPPLPPPGVGRLARALVGLGVGLAVGLPASRLAGAAVGFVAGASPPYPQGDLLWDRDSAVGAIEFLCVGVAPLIGLAVSINARVAATTAGATLLAGCGGLAAGIFTARVLSGGSWLMVLGFAVASRAPSHILALNLTAAAVVSMSSALVAGLVGFGASHLVRRLSNRSTPTVR